MDVFRPTAYSSRVRKQCKKYYRKRISKYNDRLANATGSNEKQHVCTQYVVATKSRINAEFAKNTE